MWRSRSDRDEGTVVCIACGCSVARSAAREYDKFGDRWDRVDKEFEYLCKECHRELCHQPREELEALLIELDAGEPESEDFLEWYSALVEERYGPLEEEG
jgi:phage terminase large subunit GpA-like protein